MSSQKPATRAVVQIARFAARPGLGGEIISALDEAFAAAEKEAGTVVYAIHQQQDDPDVIWMYELYESSDAQIAHSSSLATARLRATVADLLLEPISLSRANVHRSLGLPSTTAGISKGTELSENEVQDTGERAARALFGNDRYVQTRVQAPDGYRRELLRFADKVVFGQVYTSETISLRERSLCTVAALVALGHQDQLRAHLVGALNIGVTRDELAAVITQMAMYAGFPAALTAMATAEGVFESAQTDASGRDADA